jgi:hypothetical protein
MITLVSRKKTNFEKYFLFVSELEDGGGNRHRPVRNGHEEKGKAYVFSLLNM